jgi:hypothetical protein
LREEGRRVQCSDDDEEHVLKHHRLTVGGITNETVAANFNTYHDGLATPILEEVVAFVFINVNSAPSDYARLKSTHKRRRVYQSSTGGVDQNDSLFQE